ncbi:hypothetical protein FA95DRAFT_85598 [Auriscalpium vulgare]|uniref:Uncharacterized protein n=1 Tax=Auriscalpium vulgare TaxID=40419 RepID=A0ACB8RPE0_9AGAM|nr:hypothetical protein FA95DRAFT_85598 [Auriscalpium vulgare]
MSPPPPEHPTSPASSTDTISEAHHPAAHADKPRSSSSSPSVHVPWTAHLSTSLSAIAEQLQAAAQAVAQAPGSPCGAPHADISALEMRLAAVERAHAALAAELEELRGEGSSAPEGAPSDVEQRLSEALATIKLECVARATVLSDVDAVNRQDRLYPRLHNSRVTVSKLPIMALPTASGKPAPQFPATRGEFEHLIKERYEAMLKAYGLPVKGDTNAKREALRVFIGLPA